MEGLIRIAYLHPIIEFSTLTLRDLWMLMRVHSSWYEAVTTYSPDVWIRCFEKISSTKRHVISLSGWNSVIGSTEDVQYISCMGHQAFLENFIERKLPAMACLVALEHSLHNKALNWTPIIDRCIKNRQWQPTKFLLDNLAYNLFPDSTFKNVCERYCYKTIQQFVKKGFSFRTQSEADGTLQDVWRSGRNVEWLKVILECGATPDARLLDRSIKKKDYPAAIYLLEENIIRQKPEDWGSLTGGTGTEYINGLLEDMKAEIPSKDARKILELLLAFGVEPYVNIGNSCCHIHKVIKMKDIPLLKLFIQKLQGRNKKNALNIIYQERSKFDKTDGEAVQFLKQVMEERKQVEIM
jgi:hypothetical protein